MRRLLATVFIVAASACAPAPVRLAAARAPRARPVTLRVQVAERSALVIREVPLEDYVAATAASEVHPDVADEAVAARMYEVQSVITRTYALANRGRHAKDGFDLCSTTHCQLYQPARLATSRWAATATAAALKTSGEILWFADAPARAVFHADCGGYISAASAVWDGIAPAYLASQRDPGHAESAQSDWTFDSRSDLLRGALNSDPRTAVGAKLDTVEIAGRDDAGRAERIVLRGTRTFLIRGEVFREVVTRRLGVKTLRSTLFTVKKTHGTFVFTGKGFGHGVGLCQAGALARLKAGDSPKEVLAHYFPGTTLRR